MKCTIPCLNVKVFARAIHSLGRIGDELYVEPAKNGVSFRTVDSSRSAFGSFYFKTSFFSLFDFKIAENENEAENFKCKVAMKACLNAFRSMNNIEKSVEKCKLIIDPDEDRLVVIMICKYGIQKTYNLSFIECETLEADFDRSSCHYRIKSQSRVLCDAFQNFRPNQEEVTLKVSPQKMIIKNYVDDEPDPTTAIHTELTLEADEFDEYKIDANCEVTFSLKEVRSLLSFSEPVNLPISLVFTCPGTPIIFFVDNEPIFEANFVLATFNSQLAPSSQPSWKPTASSSAVNSLKRPSEVIDSVPRCNKSSLRRSSEFLTDVSCLSSEATKITSKSRTSTHQGNVSQSPKLVNRRTSSIANGREISPFTVTERSYGRPSALNCDIPNSKPNDRTVVVDSDDQEEAVPGTPPAKRRKYYFKRCFQSTFDANNISAFRRILAEDSDNEENGT